VERAAFHRSGFDSFDEPDCTSDSERDLSQVERDMCSMDTHMALAIRAIVDFLDRNRELTRIE